MTIDGRYIQIQFRDIRRRFPLIHAPEDVAAIRRHPRTLSRDLAALLYSLRTRGLGTLALREWVSRRRVRGSGARP